MCSILCVVLNTWTFFVLPETSRGKIRFTNDSYFVALFFFPPSIFRKKSYTYKLFRETRAFSFHARSYRFSRGGSDVPYRRKLFREHEIEYRDDGICFISVRLSPKEFPGQHLSRRYRRRSKMCNSAFAVEYFLTFARST